MERKYIVAGKEYNTREKHIPAPILRREFEYKGDKKKAVAEISSTGFYRLFLNGVELTKGYFAPYIANPDHIVYYDEYEVGELLREKNVVCILLGNGFGNSLDGGVWNFESAPYRSAPKVFMRLTADGEEILSTDETFEVYPSAITFDDYRAGERYDARLETEGIFALGYESGKKKNAILADMPKGEYKKCGAQPILAFERIRPVKITRSGEGYLYDFGRNNTGICRLRIDGEEGQVVDLTFGEVVKEGKLDLANISFGERSKKGYVQHDRYVCKAGVQEWQPCFTYHGFRYAYVEGIKSEQATEELLEYIAIRSNVPQRGSFVCNDETINKIQECTLCSDLSCFQYFPTDCPQREKNGWTADAALSCEQLLYNFDCAPSLREWMCNVRKAQLENGMLPGIVPTCGWGYEWGNGPAWDSVLIEIPYQLYRFTGDKEIVRENAPAIAKYFRYLETKTNADGLLGFGLGDWCEAGTHQEGEYRTPVEVTDTLTVVALAEKAGRLFAETGEIETEKRVRGFGEKLLRAFRAKYVEDGWVRCRTQTAQAMALALGAFEEDERGLAYKNLTELIEEDGGTLRVGVVGVKYLLEVLADRGGADLAYRLVKGPKYPSYGYWIEHGMTTLCESFIEFEEEQYPKELVRKDGRGQLTSLNHHFWGSVSAWFYRRLAGLDICLADRAVIRPEFVGSLDRAKAAFENGNAAIFVEWERENGGIVLSVSAKSFGYETKLPEGYEIKQERRDGDKTVYTIGKVL